MKKNIIALVLILPILINLLVFNSSEVIVNATTVKVSEVSLNTDQLSFDTLFRTQKLIATVLPQQATNKAVTFSSSAPEVASVNAVGEVTALSNGLAHITATTVDGGLTASCSVRVESYLLNTFEVSASTSSLYEGDTATITVSVFPKQAMLSSLPFFELGTENIVTVSPFTMDSETTSTKTFTATVTANRVGSTAVRVFVDETANNNVVSKSVFFEVMTKEDDVIKFVFDGATFNEQKPLITAANEIPLKINRQANGVRFSIEEKLGRSTSLAYIEEVEGESILRFTRAGTIILSYESDSDSGSVEITSTYNQIDPLSFGLLTQLEQDGIQLFFGASYQISFDIAPYDYLQYYIVEWTHTDGIAMTVFSANNLIITPTQSVNQTLTVSFTNRNTNDKKSFDIDVILSSYGISQIEFALNNPNNSIRGLERKLVMGNMDANGQSFRYTMSYSTIQKPNAIESLVFESDNQALATVDVRGTVVFNKDYEFKTPSEFVTISVRSLNQSPDAAGVYASTEYTFEVLKGSNVYSMGEYSAANDGGRAIILQSNISFSISITTASDLYGNGYRMDAYALTTNYNSPSANIFVFLNTDNLTGTNQTLITNVVFSGFEDADVLALQAKGTLVELNKNTTMQYCIVENAGVLLSVKLDNMIGTTRYANTNILVDKNILRYGGFAGVYLGRGGDNSVNASVKIGDLIMEDCLMGIMIEPGGTSNKSSITLSIVGLIRFYTWIEQSIFNQFSISIDSNQFGLEAFGVATEQYEGINYHNIAICFLEARRSSTLSYPTRARFDGATQALVGTIPTTATGQPQNGTDFVGAKTEGESYRVLITTYYSMLTTYKPIPQSDFYVSIADQLSGVRDYDLVTRAD